MKNIPSDKQVYIQSSLKQLKGIQRDYQDWIDVFTEFDEVQSVNDGMSIQGLNGKKDFPKVVVRVHEDAKELETGDDWDK